MKKSILLIVVVGAVACSQLQNETLIVDVRSNNASSHVIPLEKALASLSGFLEESTKLSETSEYAVSIVYSDQICTKSNDEVSELLYLVNFDNNEGYAVLAADDRISSSVIAFVESGSISPADFTSINTVNRTIYNGYSTTGPGLYYNADSTEVYINPNTFCTYSEEYDDNYVGDLIVEDPSDTVKKCEPFLANLIKSYAENEISTCKIDTLIGGFKDHIFDDGTTQKISYSYSSKIIVEPMFKDFSNWTQGAKFNDLCPVVFGKKTPCGCVNLATAYVMAYCEYPTQLTYNGVEIIWDNIKKPYEEIVDISSASSLTRCLGVFCNSIYADTGTFTFPSLAAKYLETLGYQNVIYEKYKDEEVRSSLQKGYPIIICSIPGIKLSLSHAWNIDGYKKYIKTTRTDYYKNNKYVKTTYADEETIMVHCNFGWNGKDNGYYTSGVFDLTKGHKDGASSGNKTNYNNYLKIITFEVQK